MTALARITDQQLEVAALLAAGHTTATAATAIGLTTHAIKTRLADAFAATGAHTQAQFVATCYQQGWLPITPPTADDIIDASVRLLRNRGPAADAILARYAERVLRDRQALEHLENALTGSNTHERIARAIALLEAPDPTGERITTRTAA